MRKLLLIIALLFAPLVLWADTTIASDSFARSACSSSCGSGGGLGANWNTYQGTYTIGASGIANETSAPGSFNPTAYIGSSSWSGLGGTTDQYSIVKFVGALPTTSQKLGPAVRVSASAVGYGAWCSTQSSNVCSVVTVAKNNMSAGTLGTVSASFTLGDAFQLRVQGHVLTVLVNGVQQGNPIVDVSNTTGGPGIASYNTFGNSSTGISYWEGGNAVAVGTTSLGSDNFTRANASTLGSNWTYSTSGQVWSISSNTAINSTSNSAFNPVYWNAVSFVNDQYSTMIQSAWLLYIPSPAVRMSTSAANGYTVYCYNITSSNCTELKLQKITAGSFSTVGDMTGLSLAPGSALTLTAKGSTLSVFYNGYLEGSYVDSTYSTGNVGMMAYGTFTSANGLTYWEGGNVGNAAQAPTFSPVAGTYFASQTVTITSSTSGATLCYTTDLSTPTANGSGTCTHGSTLTNGGSVTVSSSETLEVVASKSGYTDSGVASAAYVLIPSDSQVASDDFSAYYNANLGDGGNYTNAYQFPLDVNWTNGAWKAVAGGNLVVQSDTARGAGYYYVTGDIACTGDGYVCPAVRTAEGYNANQYSLVYLHPYTGGYSGPAVRCATDGSKNCYMLEITTTSAYLVKWVAGSRTLIASATGLTITDGSTAELRVYGTTLIPLISGASITGMSATYTDSSLTTGQPGIAATDGVGGAVGVYNWSAGNVGGMSGGYTPPSPASPSTYTDALNTSSIDIGALPWFHGRIGLAWSATLGSVVYSSSYAAGGNGSSQYEYRNVFQVNQWQWFTVAINSTDPHLYNWFAPLLHQTWIPGLSNGGCTANGISGAACLDEVGYYPGIEPINTTSRSGACTGVKYEYCGTPFVHVTKITPTVSGADNSVVLVQGSQTTLMAGDQVYEEYRSGTINVYCKESATPPAAWQSGYAYSVGNVIETSSGLIQLVTTAGTSGGTQPSSWGETWNYGSYSGASTTDGGVVWEYWGEACPTQSTFTRIISAYDADLLTPSSTYSDYANPLPSALGIGFPGLFFGTNASVPLFTSWSAGTLGYSGVSGCSTATGVMCVSPNVWVPMSFVP